MLTRDYHYLKWFLVETLELQEREIASYGVKKLFSDLVNFTRAQQNDKSMELVDPSKRTKFQDVQQAIDMIQLPRNTSNILREIQKVYTKEFGPQPNAIMAAIAKQTMWITQEKLSQFIHEQEQSMKNVEPYRGEQSQALK